MYFPHFLTLDLVGDLLWLAECSWERQDPQTGEARVPLPLLSVLCLHLEESMLYWPLGPRGPSSDPQMLELERTPESSPDLSPMG